MTNEELNAIRNFIIWKVARNYNVMCEDLIVDEETGLQVTDVIFALYEALHKAVTGDSYDYMWHWCNKIGYWCDECASLDLIIERGKEI